MAKEPEQRGGNEATPDRIYPVSEKAAWNAYIATMGRHREIDVRLHNKFKKSVENRFPGFYQGLVSLKNVRMLGGTLDKSLDAAYLHGGLYFFAASKEQSQLSRVTLRTPKVSRVTEVLQEDLLASGEDATSIIDAVTKVVGDRLPSGIDFANLSLSVDEKFRRFHASIDRDHEAQQLIFLLMLHKMRLPCEI